MTPVNRIRVCGVSMDTSFCGGSNETRPLIRVFAVFIDAPFYDGCNDTTAAGDIAAVFLLRRPCSCHAVRSLQKERTLSS